MKCAAVFVIISEATASWSRPRLFPFQFCIIQHI